MRMLAPNKFGCWEDNAYGEQVGYGPAFVGRTEIKLKSLVHHFSVLIKKIISSPEILKYPGTIII